MNYVKNKATDQKFPASSLRRQGFTLIELLVVISIIAILVALTVPVLGGIKRRQYLSHATSEMELIRTAIENYHSVFGYYPPSPSTNGFLTPQLYYELTGVQVTVNSAGQLFYTPLDGNSDAAIPTNMVQAAFGVSGFMNCTRGSGEEAITARSFLTGLKPNEYAAVSNYNNTVKFYVLVTSLNGPNPAFQPLSPNNPANPFNYNSINPTNNPQGYDLWIDLAIGNKTNVVASWTKQVTTLP